MPPAILPGEGLPSRMFCPASMALFSHQATASRSCPETFAGLCSPGEEMFGADQLGGLRKNHRSAFGQKHVTGSAHCRIGTQAGGEIRTAAFGAENQLPQGDRLTTEFGRMGEHLLDDAPAERNGFLSSPDLLDHQRFYPLAAWPDFFGDIPGGKFLASEPDDQYTERRSG